MKIIVINGILLTDNKLNNFKYEKVSNYIIIAHIFEYILAI